MTDYAKLTDRGLDAAVAEKVFGAKWNECYCRVCGWPLATSVADGCTLASCSERPVPPRRADEPEHYSTSIHDAFHVVAEMRRRGFVFEFQYGPNYVPMARFMAAHAWNAATPATRDFWTQDESAPRAICLAALRAVGSK